MNQSRESSWKGPDPGLETRLGEEASPDAVEVEEASVGEEVQKDQEEDHRDQGREKGLRERAHGGCSERCCCPPEELSGHIWMVPVHGLKDGQGAPP